MHGSWTPSIVPNGYDETVYLVLDDFGQLGRAFPVDLVGDVLPSSLEGFVERHLGPNRQLTLRLA
jgi:hypothetical protein